MHEQLRLGGPERGPERDGVLDGAVKRVFLLMRDGQWRTAGAIARATGNHAGAVPAQLAALRKARFGSHMVTKRWLTADMLEYQVLENRAANCWPGEHWSNP